MEQLVDVLDILRELVQKMKFENYTKSNETETAPIVYEKQVA